MLDHSSILFGSKVVDLSDYEKEGKYLEGTGSMVLDYQGGVVSLVGY